MIRYYRRNFQTQRIEEEEEEQQQQQQKLQQRHFSSKHFTDIKNFHKKHSKKVMDQKQQQIRQQKCRGSVVFNDDCKVILIPKCLPQEISDLWTSNNDFKKSKMECMNTIHHMTTAPTQRNHTWETRGLESMSRAGALQLKSRRQYCTMIVLDEQEDQRIEGVTDHDRIAKLYKDASYRCVASAIAQGKQDAQIIDDDPVEPGNLNTAMTE